jgi:nitronate monooxygenase
MSQAQFRAQFQALCQSLRLPLIAAPMFLVSGPDLVAEACSAGIVASFPTANCRTPEELDAWLQQISQRTQAKEQAEGRAAGPVAPNLIVHASNPRVEGDLKVLLKHKPKLVITSVGSPVSVIPPLHDVGTLVLADIATVKHAHKAIAAGADGLVLLTAGAGGQTGWLNPFAFVRAVRAFYDGPLVLAGGISDGHALRAAMALGCDLAYMGTRFIATQESMADPAYKEMLLASGADDILLTKAITGLETNMLRPSLVKAGLDPDNLPERGAIDIAKDISIEGRKNRRWKDIWSAGHSVSGVDAIRSVADLVSQVEQDYRSA